MTKPFKGQSTQKASCTKKNVSRESMRLGLLVIAANARELPVDDLITSEKGAYPAALCTENESMRETDRTALTRKMGGSSKDWRTVFKASSVIEWKLFSSSRWYGSSSKIQTHTQ